MSSNRRPWYPWYPKDFTADEKVQCLTPLAELIYRRALDLMWQSNSIRIPCAMPLLYQSLGRGIAEDDFAIAWERIMYPDFELFGVSDDGKWLFSRRLMAEAEHLVALSEKKKLAGKTGAKARWSNKKIADAKQPHGNRIANAKQTDSHTHTHTDIEKDKSFSSDSDEIRLSEYLFNHILKNNPKAKKPNFQTWAKHIDYAIRIDHRSVDDLKSVIKWSQKDNFWSTVILSTQKLRDKFDALWMKMNSAGSQQSKEQAAYNFPVCPHCGNNGSNIINGQRCPYCDKEIPE